jgi:hypothetical protein
MTEVVAGSFGVQRKETGAVIRLRVALVVSLFVAACTGSDPSTPSTAWVAGTWFSDTFVIHGIRFTIAQSGSTLSGTWGTTTNSGTLSGNVSGSRVSMIATSTLDPKSCPFEITATLTGNQMSGTSAPVNCGVSSTSSITLVKEQIIAAV